MSFLKNKEKWIAYILTFVTYASIHAIRTSWSSIKPILVKSPLFFSKQFLGGMDLTVLLSLAVCLNFFGWLAAKWNVKYYLLIGMVLLAVFQMTLAIMLSYSVQSRLLYVLVYGLIGFSSGTGWPAVYYIISKYFSKKDGIILSIWNATSQFGDLFSFFISHIIVDQLILQNNIAASDVIWTTFGFLVLMIVINYFLLKPKQSTHQQNQERETNKQKDSKKQQEQNNSQKQCSNQNKISQQSQPVEVLQVQNQQQPTNLGPESFFRKLYFYIKSDEANFINVWCLPNVIPIVLVSSMIKTVNAIIVNWLIFYLVLIELKQQARTIAILWSVSIFIGGILCGYFNKTLSNLVFIPLLALSGLLFIILEELHSKPKQIQVIISIVICGLAFGGPYNLISIAVPLLLNEQPQIKNKKGAMAAIISIMEGGSQIFSALSMFILPVIQVTNLHWLASMQCIASASILFFIEIRKKMVKKQQAVNTNSQKKIEQ